MKTDTMIAQEVLDVQKIRKDFPILSSKVNGKPLVYFDNAATSQKPWSVIKAIEHYYTDLNSNVHRGVHHLSQQATDAFEASRKKIAAFINAANDYEVIFTKGTTESINLVAHCYGKQFVKPGDVIIISALEHHSNIVPWQLLCEDRGAQLEVIPINEKGELLLDELKAMLNEKEKWLNQMPPYQGGGEMIKTCTFEKTTYNDLPFKFEAGTPNIEAAICLSAAVDYINKIGLGKIQLYEHELLEYANEKLSESDGLKFIGTADNKASVVSFIVDKMHPYDVGVILDKLGIAVRTGHHCTQPLMDFYGIPGTVRASLAFYNTKEELDML